MTALKTSKTMKALLEQIEVLLDAIRRQRGTATEQLVEKYIESTGADPRNVVLVEERSADGTRITWYCETRNIAPVMADAAFSVIASTETEKGTE